MVVGQQRMHCSWWTCCSVIPTFLPHYSCPICRRTQAIQSWRQQAGAASPQALLEMMETKEADELSWAKEVHSFISGMYWIILVTLNSWRDFSPSTLNNAVRVSTGSFFPGMQCNWPLGFCSSMDGLLPMSSDRCRHFLATTQESLHCWPQ